MLIELNKAPTPRRPGGAVLVNSEAVETVEADQGGSLVRLRSGETLLVQEAPAVLSAAFAGKSEAGPEKSKDTAAAKGRGGKKGEG